MAKTICEEIREKLEAAVSDYNKAILAKDFNAKNEAETNVKGYVAEYKKAKQDSVLYQLSQEAEPMVAAVKMLTYPILRAKSVKEDGIETGMELVDSEARINLVKVAERCKLPTAWQYKVEKLGLLLSLRAAKELGVSARELKSMTKDYRMNDLARKVEMGETPDSNSQIVGMIQTVMDEVFPGKGKANSHDAAYMWMAATRAGREAKTIRVCDARLAHNLFADVANRIITKSKYDVDYKKVKAEGSKTEPAKTEPETVVVPAESAA